MTPSCCFLHPLSGLLSCGTGTQPSPLYGAGPYGHDECALCEVQSLCLDASSLASVTLVFGAVKKYTATSGMFLLWSVWTLTCTCQTCIVSSKSGGAVGDCLSLSCFSCLNSSADSSPMCFCSAGYTGNGTHCTGTSSKCGQDSRLAKTWGWFVK